MQKIYDPNAPKKPTNLSINSDLLNEAKALKINLSATLEAALLNELKAARRDLWLAENKEAINACNKLAESHGLFADKHRVF
jgi:antitoxin CcdA